MKRPSRAEQHPPQAGAVKRAPATSRTLLRRIAPNLLLVFGSVVLVSLATEVAFRIYFHGTLATEYLQQEVNATWLGDFTQPSANTALRYELKPGVDVNWGGVRVVTSTDGTQRIASAHAPPAHPALKIAVLGDSSSFGWGVPYEQTYGELLRQLLEQRLGQPVEVRNYSVPGYNTAQERVVFESYVLPWKPDLLILHHDFNDADPIEGKPLNYMAADYGDNPLRSVAIKWFLRGIYQRQINRVMWVPEDPQHPTQVYAHYRCAGPLYEQHLRDLAAIAQEATRHHIRLLAFIFNPWLQRQTDFEQDPFYTLLHQPLARALQSDGFTVVDSYPLYQQVMASNGWENLSPLWVGPKDAHPSASGHGFIARVLFEDILSTGMLDASAKP